MNAQPLLSNSGKEVPMFDKKGVFWFLGLTFGLTWLIDLVIYLRGRHRGPPGRSMVCSCR